MTTTSETTRVIAIEWSELPNEQGDRMLWLGSWLVGSAGEEGPWFYSGRGGYAGQCSPPPGASGLRIRRWPSDGLTPEYVDLPLDVREVRTGELDFDRRQRFTRLSPSSISNG